MTKKFFTRQILVVGLAILTAGCNTAQTQTSADSGTIQADIYPPKVTFAEKTVKLEVKQEFSAQDNIESVIDDTDGVLKMKKTVKKGEAGYTVDDSEVNTEKEGTYDVSVFAVDSSGNKTTETYQVQILPVGSADSHSSIEEKTKTEEKNAAVTKQTSDKSGNTGNKTGNSTNSTTKPGSSTNNSTSAKPGNTGGFGNSSNSGGTANSGNSSGSGNSSSCGSNVTPPPTSNSGSGSSSGSSGNTTTNKPVEQPQECDHLWREIVTKKKIVDKAAYDEQVVQPAYDETVLVSEAWDEPVYDVQYVDTTICRYCGYTTTGPNQIVEMGEHILTDNGTYTTKTETIKTQTGTIHHDAVYKTVHHEATTTTVHHDEEFHYEMVVIGYECYRCGKTK